LRGGHPKVVDFSTHWSGPFASRELVYLGADVVKIENPRYGDGNRGLGTRMDGTSDVHFALNSGTRSVAFDYRSPEWPDLVSAAARWADVVVVGARPADARVRGIDFATVARANPTIVYCSITGYGEVGPWRDRPAHGLQPDVMAGAVVPEDDGRVTPAVPNGYMSHGTVLAGLWAAVGILGALARRDQSRSAQYVRVSMWEAAVAWMWRDVLSQSNFARPWPGYDDLGSRYRTYRTSDGRALLVCPTERKFWTAFVEAVGLPADWASKGTWDETGADNGYADEIPVIQDRLQQKSLEDWEEILGGAGVPVAGARTVAEAISSPHAEANGVVASVEKNGIEIKVPMPPVSVQEIPVGFLDAEDAESRLALQHSRRGSSLSGPPDLGEHTIEVLEEFGLRRPRSR
jgi:crotonobetainyl-CoA:carnitine CoA-transferase CaiB-like acyl-CoA transferase